MGLRFAAFGGTDLLFEFAPPPIDRIGHRLIHSKLRAQLDPQARTAERRALTARVGPGASIMFRTDDASMAVRTPCLARRHAGRRPWQRQALDNFAACFDGGEKCFATQYCRARRCHAPYCS